MTGKMTPCAGGAREDELNAGVSPSGKAAGFDPAIRRFESFHPSHAVGFARGAVPQSHLRQIEMSRLER